MSKFQVGQIWEDGRGVRHVVTGIDLDSQYLVVTVPLGTIWPESDRFTEEGYDNVNRRSAFDLKKLVGEAVYFGKSPAVPSAIPAPDVLIATDETRKIQFVSVEGKLAPIRLEPAAYLGPQLVDWLDAHSPTHAKACECGKEKHGFASHASWCDLHE